MEVGKSNFARERESESSDGGVMMAMAVGKARGALRKDL